MAIPDIWTRAIPDKCIFNFKFHGFSAHHSYIIFFNIFNFYCIDFQFQNHLMRSNWFFENKKDHLYLIIIGKIQVS